MKTINDITYRLADSNDNAQLLRLTEQCPMDGNLPLRIDRHPNFFALLESRGPSRVFVAVSTHRIVGSISVSRQDVYLNSGVQSVYYVADFKVSPAFRGNGIGRSLCDILEASLQSIHADVVLLTVAAGNDKPRPFFRRTGDIPDLRSIGRFHVYQLLGIRRSTPKLTEHVHIAKPAKKIIRFLNAYYQTHQLGPVITTKNLQGTVTYALTDKSDIHAIACLADMSGCKQNIVIQMPLRIFFQVMLFNTFRKLLRCSVLPSRQEAVQIIYLKYFAVAEDGFDMIPGFLDFLRNVVYTYHKTFLTIGLHEKDPLNRYFSKPFGFTFESVGMIVSLQNNQSLVESVQKGIPFEDYSLV